MKRIIAFVIRLPIRNWNRDPKEMTSYARRYQTTYKELKLPNPDNKPEVNHVIRLPIRNWNFSFPHILSGWLPVIRLPIRNWNFLKKELNVNDTEVIRLPIRNWNSFISFLKIKGVASYQTTYKELKLYSVLEYQPCWLRYQTTYKELKHFWLPKFFCFFIRYQTTYKELKPEISGLWPWRHRLSDYL